MTTIILVAIGILIAAAAALAIIFFGGDAFTVNQIRADAARLVSEGAQVQYATDLYYRERGEMPGMASNGAGAINELIDKKYLSMNPQGVINEDGSAERWTLSYGSDGMIYSRLGRMEDESAMSVCREARRQLKYSDVVPSGDPSFAGQTPGAIAVYKCDGSNYFGPHPTNTLPDREPCCIKG